MSIFKKYWIPTCSAIIFVIAGSVTMMFQIHHSDGVWIPLYQILSQSPACFFWILWFCLIFFCAYGITKQYRNKIRDAIAAYPLVNKNKVIKIARIDMAYSYSKKLLFVFAGLPFVYLSQHYDKQTGYSLYSIVILLIPFLIDLTVVAILRRASNKK